MFEVIRWISIVLMWIAVAMNLYAMHRCLRTNKKLEAERELLAALMDKYKSRMKVIEVEVSDEGQN